MQTQEKISSCAELLSKQRGYLDYYFEALDLTQVEVAVEACLQTSGLIALTGVGKSGIIAEKIAMTLISTGTRALYLPSSNFLHGDLGILGPQDMLIVLSRSGETEELLSLLPFVKGRGTRLMAIVSKRTSRLASQCDLSVYLPVERELCPFDLAPTTSTTAQLLFGDLLAMSLMRRKGFDLGSYALNHPGGTIGKNATMLVDDLMIQGLHLPLVSPKERLLDVLVELSNKKCGTLLVVDDLGFLLGIFTDGDLRRALQMQGPEVLEQSMEKLMSVAPISIERGARACDAMRLMQKNPKKFVMILPVVQEGKIIGLIRMHDLVQAGIG